MDTNDVIDSPSTRGGMCTVLLDDLVALVRFRSERINEVRYACVPSSNGLAAQDANVFISI